MKKEKLAFILAFWICTCYSFYVVGKSRGRSEFYQELKAVLEESNKGVQGLRFFPPGAKYEFIPNTHNLGNN